MRALAARRGAMHIGLACMTVLTVPAATHAQRRESLDSAVHALNRLAYGPRPGDIHDVARQGVMNWIERQLSPAGIANDRLARAEQRFELLEVSQEELARRFLAARRMARARSDSLGMTPAAADSQRRLRAARFGGQRPLLQMQQLAVTRAVLSERQLHEVLVDFWTNHFNVFMAKGVNRVLTQAYIEETIRPRVLGRFEDLLLATAQAPAMLVYLDNARSVAPGASPPQYARLQRALRRAAGPRREQLQQRMTQLEQRRPTGLNENYARELLELHTLGVDGGYTQADIHDISRILSGWSVTPLQRSAHFVFNEWAHDRGVKTVLGRTFPAGGGRDEGADLLRFLARQPSTHEHVSRKLCQRLVQDEAPLACIEAATRAWTATDGDIREVVRAIVRSAAFWAASARRTKAKTPLEFVVSAVRAVGGEPDSTPRLAATVARLGQPLFLSAPPTGYPEHREAWINAGALLQRMQVAAALGAGKLGGVVSHIDRHYRASAQVDDLLLAIDSLVFGGQLTPRTLAIIRERVDDVSTAPARRHLALGLALGGPDFQVQ